MTDIIVRDSDKMIVQRGEGLTAATGFTRVQNAPANAIPGRSWVSSALGAPPLEPLALAAETHKAYLHATRVLINPGWADIAGDATKGADSLKALRHYIYLQSALDDLIMNDEFSTTLTQATILLAHSAIMNVLTNLIYPVYKDLVDDTASTRSSWRDSALSDGSTIHSDLIDASGNVVANPALAFTALTGNVIASGFDPESPTLGRT